MLELMVAMVVASIVLTGIFSFSAVQRGLANEHGREVRADQSLDGAMWAIGQDLQMAGMGFARNCTELRIWDQKGLRLLNPGAIQDPTQLKLAAVDAATGEPFWVLRDGLQAHWKSSGATSLGGSDNVSSAKGSAADSFDVLVGDPSLVAATGVFQLDATAWYDDSLSAGPAAVLDLRSVSSTEGSTALGQLDSGQDADLRAAQQLFAPGSFVMIMARGIDDAAFRAVHQRQCILLQVTGNLRAGGNSNRWELPISNASGFNANLADLLGLSGAASEYKPAVKNADTGGTGDFEPSIYEKALVVPLGNLRWSRYEVDYSQAKHPYLVRTDIIGIRRGEGTFPTLGVSYPGCSATDCPAATLRLPGRGEEPPRYAIAPMIEDMQVAVACDGYTSAGVDARRLELADPHSPMLLPPPDLGHEETDGNVTVGNVRLDEATTLSERASDEWLGNADGETWGPDCVFYGTGETYRESWSALSATPGAAAFRMSPQAIRVSMVARQIGKGVTQAGGTAASTKLAPLEDRVLTNAVAPGYPAQIRTERFAPRNLRWRDPAVP